MTINIGRNHCTYVTKYFSLLPGINKFRNNVDRKQFITALHNHALRNLLTLALITFIADVAITSKNNADNGWHAHGKWPW